MEIRKMVRDIKRLTRVWNKIQTFGPCPILELCLIVVLFIIVHVLPLLQGDENQNRV